MSFWFDVLAILPLEFVVLGLEPVWYPWLRLNRILKVMVCITYDSRIFDITNAEK